MKGIVGKNHCRCWGSLSHLPLQIMAAIIVVLEDIRPVWHRWLCFCCHPHSPCALVQVLSATLNEGWSTFVWTVEEMLLLSWAMAVTVWWTWWQRDATAVRVLTRHMCVWKCAWSQASTVSVVERGKKTISCRSWPVTESRVRAAGGLPQNHTPDLHYMLASNRQLHTHSLWSDSKDTHIHERDFSMNYADVGLHCSSSVWSLSST